MGADCICTYVPYAVVTWVQPQSVSRIWVGVQWLVGKVYSSPVEKGGNAPHRLRIHRDVGKSFASRKYLIYLPT